MSTVGYEDPFAIYKWRHFFPHNSVNLMLILVLIQLTYSKSHYTPLPFHNFSHLCLQQGERSSMWGICACWGRSFEGLVERNKPPRLSADLWAGRCGALNLYTSRLGKQRLWKEGFCFWDSGSHKWLKHWDCSVQAGRAWAAATPAWSPGRVGLLLLWCASYPPSC